MAISLSRTGEKDSTSTNERELFLDIFTGEVLTEFERRTVMKGRQNLRTIKNGKSARMDAMGEASAAYHTPGNQLAGSTIKHDDFLINIDQVLLSHAYIAEIDELMNAYEVRSKYSAAFGRALAKTYDCNLLQLLVLAARADARVPDGPGGTVIEDTDAKTDTASLVASIFQAQVEMDEKDVPEEGRFCIMRPTTYSRLVQHSDVIDMDVGGEGSVSKGTIKALAGFELIKSNNMPITNITGTYSNKYDVDASNTVCVCGTNDAVGTVQLMGLKSEKAWLTDYQSTLLLSKMAVGHGIITPPCAVEITEDDGIA